MFRKISGLVVLTMVTVVFSVAQAGNRQTVTTCLKVNNNHSKFSFQAQFVSTDMFDHWRAGPTIYNGEICHHYTYEHGPKTLSVKVNTHQPKVYFELDNACVVYGFYVNRDMKTMEVKHRRSSAANVKWDFKLVEKSHTPDLSIFNVNCRYQND